MRIFEIVLILFNVLWLFMSLKKQSRGVRIGIAGANLAAFLIHGLYEGFRYQMIFSYIFVTLLAVYTIIKLNRRFFEARFPRVLKAIIISLALLCLVFTSVLAYALPVFTLPRPTGDHDVGITYHHLIDEKRDEPFLDPPTAKRELMIKVYYPAKGDDTKPFSAYFHNSPEFIKLFTAGYGLPDFLFDHFSLVKTHAKENLQIADTQQNYPVILFSHGGGTTMEVHASQCEDLASNGYIVVAIEHTYVAGATLFPDKIVSARDATTMFDAPDPIDIINQIMVEDAQFILDTLSEMNEGTIPSLFKARLNLQEIGAIGQSLGGAVAYNLAINDKRVKAAINLDGSVYITPGEEPQTMAPFLMLANDEYHVQAIQNRQSLMKKLKDMDEEMRNITLDIYGGEEAYYRDYEKSLQNVTGLYDVAKESRNLYTIEGSAHMKFADIGLFMGISQLRELVGINGSLDPARCLEITEAVTVAFFDQHLKDNPPQSLLQQYPELKQVELQ